MPSTSLSDSPASSRASVIMRTSSVRPWSSSTPVGDASSETPTMAARPLIVSGKSYLRKGLGRAAEFVEKLLAVSDAAGEIGGVAGDERVGRLGHDLNRLGPVLHPRRDQLVVDNAGCRHHRR